MDFDSVWTLFVFIIGIGGWILDRMKKAKEENAKRQRGPSAPAGAPVAPASPSESPAPATPEEADPFESLRRFLEEVEKGPKAPRPPPSPPPRPVPAPRVERPARRRPVEKVIRPELLRVEKPVRRVAPAPAPAQVPEPAAAAPGRAGAQPPSAPRSSVLPVRAALHGRKNLRAALVASEVLGTPMALRTPGSRPF